MESKLEEELRNQLDQVTCLLSSKDWIIWLNYLRKERPVYLRRKLEEAVDADNQLEAKVIRALQKDCNAQIQRFSEFVTGLKARGAKS